MSLSDPLKNESEIAARPLYRAGQNQPAKAPKKVEKSSSFLGGLFGGGSSAPAKPPAKAPSPYPSATPRPGQPVSVKKTAPKGPGGLSERTKRILRMALIALIMLLLGTGSYYAFEPDPVDEIQELRKAAFAPGLSREERGEKFKELRKVEKNLTDKQRFQLERNDMKRMLTKTREFGKMSQQEKIEQIKKDIKEGEERRKQWEARRKANGGAGGGPGGGGGRGAGGAGGAGGGNRVAGGGGAGGGGGMGGGAGAGRGGPGGGGGGGGFGPGGFGGGGPGGWGRGGGDSNQRQKTRLDNMSPEDRAQHVPDARHEVADGRRLRRWSAPLRRRRKTSSLFSRDPEGSVFALPSGSRLNALLGREIGEVMLTAEGCRQRRLRLWERLDPPPDGDHLRLSDPIHLMYLANFHVDPFSLGAGFGGYLLLRKDGSAKLLHDDRLPKSVSERTSRSGRSSPGTAARRRAAGRVNWPSCKRSTLPSADCASTTGPAILTPLP